MNVMNIKLVLSFLLLTAGLGGFYILFDHPVLVGFVTAIYVFSTTTQGDRLLKFIKEAITEAKKVVWPTRKETIQMTLVVFVLVVIMAIFLAFVDIFFSYVINILLGRGS
jgi:preprotein translocase subunit SecE